MEVHDPNATVVFEPSYPHVKAMFDRAFTNLVGKASVSAAWLSLVSTQDVVGIKVFSAPGQVCGTRPAVVEAIVQGLLAAGLPTNHIVIWDKYEADLQSAGFFDLARRYGVRVEGAADVGYDETNFYDTPLIGKLVWGDFEFGKKGEGVGRKSFVSKLVSQEITKIINVPPLLNNNFAGVTGNLYSLTMGAVDNATRFESDSDRLATAVPEIYALPSLSDRVVLNVVDALLCQYEGNVRGLLQYSTVLNQLWLSRDPVALDVLSLDELKRQREIAHAPPIRSNQALYANAVLLELGINDPKQISVNVLNQAIPANTNYGVTPTR